MSVSTSGGDGDPPVRLETGSYILRSLIKDIALSADGEGKNVKITCVELYSDNLYIGTSAGEILHHVRIPPDPSDPDEQPTYILASRTQPPVNQGSDSGIQQILLLPSVNKACILCSNTLTFYTLPELSPAFPQQKPLTCGWVGGVDQNVDLENAAPDDGVVIIMCLRNRVRLVKIRDVASRIRDIEFGACVAIARRGDYACVADTRSYALLDVVNQRKIPLFPISSVDDQPAEKVGTNTVPEESGRETSDPINKPSRSHSTTAGALAGRLGIADRGHGRSTSLGVFRTDSGQEAARSSSPRYGFDAPASLNRQPSPGRRASPRPVSFHAPSPGMPPDPRSEVEISRPVSPALPVPVISEDPAVSQPAKTFTALKPIVASPSESEFLLTTGTEMHEPGIGMIINLDGEMARGTLEFASYPEFVVVDGKGSDPSASGVLDERSVDEEGFALAVVRRTVNGALGRDVEIQRWDINPGDSPGEKEWLGIASSAHGIAELGGKLPSWLGLRCVAEKTKINLSEIVEKLALRPSHIVQPDAKPAPDALAGREHEETELIRRLCTVEANLVLWFDADVHWMLRNPLVLKLDARLKLAQATSVESNADIAPQKQLIERLINDIRGLRPRSELEFFTLGYIRQKAALLHFMDLLLKTMNGDAASDADKRSTEDALIESELDPRVIISFIPDVEPEILAGPDGVWIHGGLRDLIDRFTQQTSDTKLPTDARGILGSNLLHLVKRYLAFWRRKKGNPSVADGAFVFPTVDAALLKILLILDRSSPRGPASAGSLRAELNTVVDTGVDCFDRAVEMLEQHMRLYLLSRLYQSRKMSAKVLATWKRIISGDVDAGGEFVDGESELRKYLGKMRDRNLVVEYGTWLATRNPRLGVQVFADNNAKVKIEMSEALAILREKAPLAVKYYLEHLVFDKRQSQHINELITYYLDIVLTELRANPSSRAILQSTYETYRALQPPKPTYHQFIVDNAMKDEWWQARLRLLQLLGSSSPTPDAPSYDVATILARLADHSTDLVPEVIILSGRQGRHEEALRLLTHGLGDFDTAISYCLLGGRSIFAGAGPGGAFSRGDLLVADGPPSRAEQAILFRILLLQFLQIENISQRVERTGELLERFGGWFEVEDVLSLLPDEWAIGIFSGFLVQALGRLVRERREALLSRALEGARNLKVEVEVIDKVEAFGPVVVGADEGAEVAGG